MKRYRESFPLDFSIRYDDEREKRRQRNLMNSTYDCIENERRKKERDEHPGIRAYHDKEYDENR